MFCGTFEQGTGRLLTGSHIQIACEGARGSMRQPVERFIALDVEIASRSPVAVCAIGAARFESGHEIGHYCSLVRFPGRVGYTQIHGLTRADLRDAPPWPVVWKNVVELIADVTSVVAYRAAFDRAAVMTMCARHALRMPRIRFVCAAKLYEARVRRPADLAAALRALDIPFPGHPHDPLADARAAAALVLALQGRKGGGAIQLSKIP